MNARKLSLQKSFTTQSGEQLNVAARGSLYDLQSQLKIGSQQQSISDKRPIGSSLGDTTTRLGPYATIAIAFYDGQGGVREVFVPMGLVGNSAIASPSGGATVDAEARTAIDAVLTLLRNCQIIQT